MVPACDRGPRLTRLRRAAYSPPTLAPAATHGAPRRPGRGRQGEHVMRHGMLRIAIVLGLVGLATMSNPAPAGAADEVRIGVVSPMTGPTAKFGQAQKNALSMAADDVNAAGGIKSLGGAKIRLVFGDTRGEADTGVTETERLITREKVHALIGAFQSGVGFPSSAMADPHQVPWLTFRAFDQITERGFKYVFRAHANDTIKARTLIEEIGRAHV